MTKTETTTTESIDLREPQGFAEYEAARALAAMTAVDPEVSALLAKVADGLYGGDPA